MFKEKSTKKRLVVNESAKDHSTLDARHQLMIAQLHERQQQLSELEARRSALQASIASYQDQIHQYKVDGVIDTPEYDALWSSNLSLREEALIVDQTMRTLRSFREEIDYYENTGYILFQYYDLLQKQDHGCAVSANPPTPTRPVKGRKKQVPIATRSILDAFGCTSQTETVVDEEQPHVIDKSSLVDEYLTQTDCGYLRPMNQDALGVCIRCTEPLVCLQQEGIMVCAACGYQELLLVEQNRPILRQPSKDGSHFSYKRINHFREWCSQVQGRESTDIPESIFEQILQEIKKEKIVDTKKITYNKMREILKKLKINKYYEHINYIINRINGVPTPHFSPELEERLCSMFKEIQGPFLRHCPKDRKNFLSYSYVLYKFFQLLGQTDKKYLDYCKYFPLLKSRQKLYVQDQIFKAICHDLGWPAIPSL
jgi:hypothetical protein